MGKLVYFRKKNISLRMNRNFFDQLNYIRSKIINFMYKIIFIQYNVYCLTV